MGFENLISSNEILKSKSELAIKMTESVPIIKSNGVPTSMIHLMGFVHYGFSQH
jgi:hypothetical protein